MAKQYLDSNGLLYFWQKIKNAFVPTTRKVNGKALSADISLTASDVNALPSSTAIPTKTSDLNNDSGFITSADIPEGPAASTATPLMDGTAAVGTEMAFARGDHRHPSDTSKVPTTRKINGKALSADIELTGANIDYDDGAMSVDDAIADLENGKVDKVTGKGLSTNDYTTTEKNKLAGIAAGAEANVVTAVTHQPASHTLLVKLNTANVFAVPISGGYAPLDSNGKISSSYLPSYVDDVVEAYARSGQTALSENWLATGSASGTVITPETGKIYVLMADSGDYAANTQFRWGGSAYVKLSDGGVSSITNAEIDTIVAS